MWGVREQQRLSFSPFADQRLSGWLTRRESGIFLDFLADPMVLLCCNALQVLCWDEDTLGAPEQSCSYYTAFAPPWQCMFWWRVYCYGKHVIRHYDEVLTMLDRACDVFPFWRGTVVMSTLRRPWCICGFWRMVTYLALCDRIVVATGPLPAMGRGAMTPGRQRHPSPAIADALWYLLLLCTWAHEQVLVRGLWEAGLGDSV